jgi:L-cystine transport system permease protein
MPFDFNQLWTALQEAFQYTPTTLLLAFAPLAIGTAFGTGVALLRVYRVRFLARFFQGLIVIFKGVPVVLLLLTSYFLFVNGFDAIAEKLNWSLRSRDISSIYIAVAALSLFATVYISEAVRGALLSVEAGQYEAAYSVGLTKAQALRRIVLPQALPVAVPMLCSTFIGLVKGSSLAFMISVTDLLNAALITATGNYKFLEAYVAAALVYWAICIAIERSSYFLEKRLTTYRRKLTA